MTKRGQVIHIFAVLFLQTLKPLILFLFKTLCFYCDVQGYKFYPFNVVFVAEVLSVQPEKTI